MAKQIMLAGTTSRREYIFILDSSSTVGAGKTGLTSATAGWKVYYVRPGAAPVLITLGTAVAAATAFTSASFSEVDATNMPGIYRFDVPDAVFAAGQDKAIVMLSGPTNVAPVTLEYQLTAAGEPWIAGGVWNAQLTNYATAGTSETFSTDTYGTKVMRTVAANRPSAVNTANAHVVGSMANGAITSAAIAAAALDSTKFADDALVIQSATGIGIKIRFAPDAITSTVIATDAITNAELAATSVQEIWDYNISAYVTAGIAGTYLKNAGGAGNPWLTDISSAVTYPLATTAGGQLRSAYTETFDLSTKIANLPINVWTSIITSDSPTYGSLTSYTMVDVMALLAKGYCAVFGTVQASPAPTTTTAKTSLTGYVNSAFNDQTIVFLKGSNIAGSCTVISSSNASGNLVFDEPLHQQPVTGDEFMILPMHVHLRSAIADKTLGRSIAGGADGGRTVTSALRAIRNRTSITGTVLTVTDETDNLSTGVAWTANLTTNSAALPITGIDPV